MYCTTLDPQGLFVIIFIKASTYFGFMTSAPKNPHSPYSYMYSTLPNRPRAKLVRMGVQVWDSLILDATTSVPELPEILKLPSTTSLRMVFEPGGYLL